MAEHDIKKIDSKLDSIFTCECEEPVPVSLMRAAAKSIASTYPDNGHRSAAIEHIINAVGHLKQAESDAEASLP